MAIINKNRKGLPRNPVLEENLVLETFEILLCFAIAAGILLFMVFVEALDRIVRSKFVQERFSKSVCVDEQPWSQPRELSRREPNV